MTWTTLVGSDGWIVKCCKHCPSSSFVNSSSDMEYCVSVSSLFERQMGSVCTGSSLQSKIECYYQPLFSR